MELPCLVVGEMLLDGRVVGNGTGTWDGRVGEKGSGDRTAVVDGRVVKMNITGRRHTIVVG